MRYLTIYLIVTVAISVTPFCNGQTNNNTDSGAQVLDADAGPEEKSSLQKGMEPVYDLYHNFLDSVMPYNFYEESDTAFSVQDLIYITKHDDYSQLREDWQSLVKTFGGIAACILCGLLFLVVMPIVGLVYCCCHCCCHKCGGTREHNDPKYAKCKRVTYTSLLLIFTTLMLAGAIITFLGSELLHQSLKNEDNNGLLGSMDKGLEHMQTFVNTTLNDIKTEARTKIIDVGLKGILKSITETALTTVSRVQNAINATSLLDQADNVGAAAELALTDLTAISASLTNLTMLQSNVTDTLNRVKTDVNTACGGSSCPGVDVSGLDFNPNFDSLSKLSDELSKVSQANNITDLVTKARQEFDTISTDVNNTVSNQITDANAEIDSLNATISKEIDKLDGNSQKFVDAMKDGRTFTTDEEKTVQDIGNYIWYSCIGMACAVVLVVIFYYLGVLFGLCGERPTPDAACCNKGTGANLICTGICCSFLFCWILMLVVILTFSLGGLSYTMACKYLNEGPEHIDTFEDVISEGFGWNISSTFNTTNLTIAGMFRNCKVNQGVYTALNLKFIFDVDKEFDISAVEDEVMKIVNKTNVSVGDITLLSPELKDQLKDFTASNISVVNYTTYIEESTQDLFSVDLSSTIQTLNTSANDASLPPNTRSTLGDAVAELATVKDVLQPQINEQVAILTTSVRSLESNSNVTEQINKLIDDIEKSETKFNTDKDIIVTEQLQKAALGILDNIKNVVNETKDAIKYDIGKCRSLYDAAKTVVHSACIVTLDPFNAIWFGLGWSLFFYIPSFIFAALLANLYKRQNKYVEQHKPDFDDVTHAPYSGYENGYQSGSRNEEQYPLTRVDNNRGRDKVGSSNYAYEGRDHEYDPRYHRDGAQPYHVGYPGQGSGGDSRGPTYARPHAGPQDTYDGYDMTPPPRYDDVRSHGGYPKLRNY